MTSLLPCLEGERVTLRPQEEGDLDALAAIVTSEGVCEWWGPPASLEDTREDLRSDGVAFTIQIGGALLAT